MIAISWYKQQDIGLTMQEAMSSSRVILFLSDLVQAVTCCVKLQNLLDGEGGSPTREKHSGKTEYLSVVAIFFVVSHYKVSLCKYCLI